MNFNCLTKLIAPLWQVTSSWCGAGDGFHSCQQKACQIFSINNTLPLPANHTVSLCAFWVWEYSFWLFFSHFAFEELNCFHDEFATHFAWRFLIYFSIQISLIALCSPWENSVTDHINTVLTKSEFQLSPASPVAQSDVSIRQLSVTVSFVRRNWFTSDKKVVFNRLILAPYTVNPEYFVCMLFSYIPYAPPSVRK